MRAHPTRSGLKKLRVPQHPHRTGRPAAPLGDGDLGAYFQDINRYPLLSRAEEVALARRLKEGDREAFEALITSSLRFVVTVAKRYQKLGLPLQDLINEGNVGLVRAAQRFDHSRGVKFISYAVWWIRQAILEALMKQSMVARMPLSRARVVNRMAREVNLLAQELGREPTANELARRLGAPPDEIQRLLAVTSPPVSLDAPRNVDDDARLHDYIPDEGERLEEVRLQERDLARILGRTLGSLSDREARILRLYYGLDREEPKTLEEIGSLFGITRERVRQIKERALERLRHPAQRKALEIFLS